MYMKISVAPLLNLLERCRLSNDCAYHAYIHPPLRYLKEEYFPNFHA